MKKIFAIILFSSTLALVMFVGYFLLTEKPVSQTLSKHVDGVNEMASSNILRTSSKKINFTEDFETPLVVQENWPMRKSGHPDWWVSSGGIMYFENGVGRTITNNLPSDNPWVARFNSSNPIDTNNGTRPQNIFRVVLKNTAKNFTQSSYYRITKYDVNQSSNRNASNGILLFNRYKDENTLYYTGVRVDGQVVVKKKLAGLYSTLAIKKVIEGQYDIQNNPNLIPLNEWIGIKSDVVTDDNGLVHIKVYTDIGRTGKWTLQLDALDDGVTFGKTISKAGYGGIRTDFMDVEFDNYTFVSH